MLASLLSLALVGDVESDRRENVVFFLVDDLGWKDLAYMGSEFYETPNIDALAKDGMVFTNGYAACPVCSPTRSSIMTGKYPARTANTDWFGAPQPGERYSRNTKLAPASYVPRMVLEEKTLAEAFKDEGYRTAFLGKWHLGGEGFYPEDQGFEINVGGTRVGNPGRGGYYAPFKVPVAHKKDGEYLTDRLAEEASGIVMRWKDEPFLLYLSFYNVHTPLEGREDLVEYFRAKKKRMGLPDNKWGTEGKRQNRLVQSHAVYASMVRSMDMAVGRVVGELKKQGIYDDTVIVFFSDNGGLSTSEGHPTSNLPLRAGKGWLYEGGVREPLIVRAPRMKKGKSGAVVSSVDFYPTLMELVGLKADEKQAEDGVSFANVMRGKPYQRGAIYWHYPHYGNQGGYPGSAVRDGKWKLIDWFEPGMGVELYDLSVDPGEQWEVGWKYPEVRDELLGKVRVWRKSVGARMPTVNEKYDPGRVQ